MAQASLTSATSPVLESRANVVDADDGEHAFPLARVLQICGASQLGLGIEDCARLCVVSRECKDIVEQDDIWNEVLNVLEADFPLVPLTEKLTWRKTLGEPRYDETAWEASNPAQRFRKLLDFAQRVVQRLREIPQRCIRTWARRCEDEEDVIEPPTDIFDRSYYERNSALEKHVSRFYNHLNLLKREFPHRLYVALQLFASVVTEEAFHSPNGFEVFNVEEVMEELATTGDAFMEGYKGWKSYNPCVDRDEEGNYCPVPTEDWTEELVDLPPLSRADCGTYLHLATIHPVLATSADSYLNISVELLGTKLYRSLRMFPVDFESLAGLPPDGPERENLKRALEFRGLSEDELYDMAHDDIHDDSQFCGYPWDNDAWASIGLHPRALLHPASRHVTHRPF